MADYRKAADAREEWENEHGHPGARLDPREAFSSCDQALEESRPMGQFIKLDLDFIQKAQVDYLDAKLGRAMLRRDLIRMMKMFCSNIEVTSLSWEGSQE